MSLEVALAGSQVRSPARAADLLALTKPRITGLVLCTTAPGVLLAPGHIGVGRLIATLVGTALVVGGANALNCYVERASDARMWRTRNRPLPAGRLEPQDGLLLGLMLAMISIPLLCLAINPLTGFLALLALVSYVWVYTPLKRVTPKALLVGAIPGAIPPLLGWVAVTDRLDAGGLWLFAIMFVWQLPHFLAITLYLKEDYARGGLRVMPLVRGDRLARLHLFAWTVVLVPVTLSLVALHLAGPVYAAVAVVLGLGFLWMAGRCVRAPDGPATQRAARAVFAFSIVYLLLLFGVLVADHGHLAQPAGSAPTASAKA